eukprot:g3104.t1
MSFQFSMLQGVWKAQFDMPIQYEFINEKELRLIIQSLEPVTLAYELDTSGEQWKLDIQHAGGPLGKGVERCIFKFESSGDELHIASPLPQGSNSFGPRPPEFGGVTTVVFTRPGSEQKIRERAMAEVAHKSETERLIGYFTEALELLKQAQKQMKAVMQQNNHSNPMELIMMEQMQMATKMRKVEMKYHSVMSKVEAKFKGANPYDWEDKVVQSKAKQFLEKVREMEEVSQQHAMTLMMQQQQAAAKTGSDAGSGAGGIIPNDFNQTAVETANLLAADKDGDGKVTAQEMQEAMSDSLKSATHTKTNKKKRRKKKSRSSTALDDDNTTLMLVGAGALVLAIGAFFYLRKK